MQRSSGWFIVFMMGLSALGVGLAILAQRQTAYIESMIAAAPGQLEAMSTDAARITRRGSGVPQRGAGELRRLLLLETSVRPREVEPRTLPVAEGVVELVFTVRFDGLSRELLLEYLSRIAAAAPDLVLRELHQEPAVGSQARGDVWQWRLVLATRRPA